MGFRDRTEGIKTVFRSCKSTGPGNKDMLLGQILLVAESRVAICPCVALILPMEAGLRFD